MAHVTHEAVEKVGGIGTVLEGLLTSREYQNAVHRSILVGPMGGHHYESPLRRLGGDVTVQYSSIDGIDTGGFARRFQPIEWAFGTSIAYGIREYVPQDSGSEPAQAEILLFDVSNPNLTRLNAFKAQLWERFRIEASRFQHDWGFEEYCRLAEPAFYTLNALLEPVDRPCVIVSHEFMGMCTALKAVLDGGEDFRTVFHAHECATARDIVEHLPGHDTAFYNIMHQAAADGLHIGDVFGDQSGTMRHALISNAYRLDAIMAVGDATAEEMCFLNKETSRSGVDLVYNGLPAYFTDLETEEHSRELMNQWAQAAVGYRPDYFMTHVARPVISKGFWRDLKVAGYMEDGLKKEGKRALVIILTCGASPRSYSQVRTMAENYGWPANHQEGYPDLVGPEVELEALIADFNKGHEAVQVVLVNQFGWSRDHLGPAAPQEMTFADLRRAADVEFGQSVYEPFGISQLEPLGNGAICVATPLCGCVSAYKRAVERLGGTEADYPNVLISDYTELNGETPEVAALLNMSRTERDAVEERVSKRVAAELLKRLPRSTEDERVLIEKGQELLRHMTWDYVVRESLLPVMDRILKKPKTKAIVPSAHGITLDAAAAEV